jgi:hypothetical protein
MAFFVVADPNGIHIYEYVENEISLRPEESFVGRANKLEKAEQIEAELAGD